MRERADDFTTRRKHLAALSEDQLKERFWELADRLTEPLVELARTHTSPSIERSVLLRMGFSSIEARAIVERIIDNNLMGKGAGHVVFRVAAAKELGIREAGVALAEGRFWPEAAALFGKGGKG